MQLFQGKDLSICRGGKSNIGEPIRIQFLFLVEKCQRNIHSPEMGRGSNPFHSIPRGEFLDGYRKKEK